jgi:hypothetical protein
VSIRIIYQGFLQETPSADAIAILTKVFKGNQAKAEEAFFSKDFVLQTVNSEAELPLILPRLEKMGIRCKWVNDDEFQSEAMDTQAAAFVRIVTCPACGHQQMPADACRECHQSFVIKHNTASQETPTSTTRAINRSPNTHQTQPDNNDSIMEKFSLSGLSLPRLSPRLLMTLGAAALLLAMGSGNYSNNMLVMLIKGIANSDPNEVAKSAHYDPESGVNPYAEKVKSLGVDQKKFSTAAGVKDGELQGAEVGAHIAKNTFMKGAIDHATASSAHSEGNTDQDKKIEEATGEKPVAE